MLPFGLNTAPQVFTRLGHTVTGYLHRQGISVIPYQDDWLIHHPDRSFTPTSRSANKYSRPRRLCTKQKEIRAGPDSGSPVSRNPFTSGLRGSFPSRVQSLGDSCTRTPSILPPCTNLYSSVPTNGVTQLGLRSYPSGSFVPSTSFSLVRSDRPVYATAPFRPTGPCQPSAALAGPTFSYLRNQYLHVSSGIHDFYGHLHAGVGRSHGGFPDFGYLDPYRPQAPNQLFGAQGGNLCPTAWGSSAPGPPGHDCYGQFDSSFVYQQARRDPFPHLATFDSRASPLVRGSEHHSPSKTYSRLSERDSRPSILSESANTNRVVPSPQNRETYLQGLGDTRSRHVCNSVEHPLVFPYCRDLLSQQDQKYVSDGKSYHLHAWRLSCGTIKQQGFQTRSLGSQQLLEGPQPIACRTISGFASLDGPQGKGLIHLIPQQLK